MGDSVFDGIRTVIECRISMRELASDFSFDPNEKKEQVAAINELKWVLDLIDLYAN